MFRPFLFNFLNVHLSAIINASTNSLENAKIDNITADKGIIAGLVFVMQLLIHLIWSRDLQYTVTDSLPPLGMYLLAVNHSAPANLQNLWYESSYITHTLTCCHVGWHCAYWDLEALAGKPIGSF